MDPLSFSASVAGLLSLAIEVTKTLKTFISDVKAAPQEAKDLNLEISLISTVLERLVDVLRSDDTEGTTFDQQCLLYSVITACQSSITNLYKKLSKLRSCDKLTERLAWMKWPFQKDECQQSIQALHRYTQTLNVLLAVSNRSLLAKAPSDIVLKLEEQHRQTMLSIEMMKEHIGSVPESMMQMSDNISTVISLISDLARSGAQIQRIHDGVENLEATLKDDELDKVLGWISSLDPQKRHQDIKAMRLGNTGMWFLERPEFQLWREGDNSTGNFNPVLACYGIPGAGKSVMCSLVIDHLSTSLKVNGNRTFVGYVYCDYRDEVQQTAVNMIGAILKQVLASHSNDIPRNIITELNDGRRKSGNLNFEKATEVLNQILPHFNSFYICIDALDECRDDPRMEFLRSISSLVECFKNSTRVFVTGRPHMKAKIQKSFSSVPYGITLEASVDDIRRYVCHKLEQDDNYDDMEDSFKSEIVESIVETADGMFLLPALQIQTVLEQTSISRRRAALRVMPKKLDDAFLVTIHRIRQQPAAQANQAMEVLKWIYLAKRQLTVIELRHALSVTDFSAKSFDQNNLPFEKTLIDCCYGLVIIDKETSSFRFVHKSLQDFLDKKYESGELFQAGHREIARVCLTYMKFKDSTIVGDPLDNYHDYCQTFRHLWSPYFNRRKSGAKNVDVFPHVQKLTFLKYAIHHWGEHARIQMDDDVILSALELFRFMKDPKCISRGFLSAATFQSSYMDLKSEMSSFTFEAEAICCGLHLAAHFNAVEIAKALLHQFNDIDINSTVLSNTPLIITARNGHEAMLRFLLEEKEINIEAKDQTGMTSLSHAAYHGHESTVRLLLEHSADVHTRDEDGRTPLSLASEGGHEGIVRILLEKGADAESVDEEGRTSLAWAAAQGHCTVVRLLFESGADIHKPEEGRNGQTPLMLAVQRFAEETVRFLLDNGADVNFADDVTGQTPLLLACSRQRQGGKSTVRLLLDRGANIDKMDRYGSTPLSKASVEGNVEIGRTLIEAGADIESKNEYGRTPLARAAYYDNYQFVCALIDAGADIESKDEDGRTPLSRTRSPKIVSILVEKGANINSTDKDGRTPLSHAVGGGKHRKPELVQTMIDKGSDVNLSDKNGRTPLSWIQQNDSPSETETVINLLLDNGATITSTDNDGRTPLSWAAASGHWTVARVLLEKGAEFNLRDNDGRTPLSWAAANGDEILARVLLEKCAEFNLRDDESIESKDEDGRTPLSWARSPKIVSILVEKGANINSTDKDGRTPLSHAVEFESKCEESPKLVQTMIEKGSDVNLSDKNGRTPLFWTCQDFNYNFRQIREIERVINILLDNGATITSTDNHGRTLLSWAAVNGHEYTARMLLDKGAEINLRDNEGKTPLGLVLSRLSEEESNKNYHRIRERLPKVEQLLRTRGGIV